MRLTYQAPLDCPTQRQFEAQVSQRLPLPWLAIDEDSARRLSVAVVHGPALWQASLTYRGNDGNELTRSLTASTCEASVAAIALATALLVEALVDTDPARPTQSRDTAAPVESPAQGTLSATRPIAPAKANALQGPAVVPAPAKRWDSSASPSSAWSRRRPDLSVGVAAVSGMSVSPAYGLIVLTGIPIASTLLRLGVAAYQSSMAATDLRGVGIRARVLAAVLEGCPISLRISAQAAVPLCASVTSGVLTTSSQIDPATGAIGKASSDFWFMASLSPRLHLQGPRFFARFGPDLVVPVTRREFVVSRESGELERAYRTPLVAGGVQLGLGMQF